MRIRRATRADAAAVAAIYAPYVIASTVSFEADPPSEREMRARIEAGAGLHPWLVAADGDGALLGYASASPFRARPAYRFTVETSVYLDRGAVGRGVGEALLRALVETLEAQGFAQAIAAITLPNEASVRLHEKLGFANVGTYRDVGFKLGRWLSVGLWQRPLAAIGPEPSEPRPLAAVDRG